MPLDSFTLYSIFSVVALTTLGLLLCFVRIENTRENRKIRTARNVLVLGYFLVALPDIFNLFVTPYTDDKSLITVIAASAEGIIFTFVLVTMIQPRLISRKRLLVNIFAVTAGSAGILTADCLTGEPAIVYIGIALLFTQLSIYTRFFLKCYNTYVAQIADYYDEDQEQQLRWAKTSYFAAAAVCILAMTSLFFPTSVFYAFVYVYVFFYIWFAGRFINYISRMNYYLPAVTAPTEQEIETEAMKRIEHLEAGSLEKQKNALRETLEKYVRLKKYLDPECDRNRIMSDCNLDLYFFRWYFKTEIGQDFRVWRAYLRIEEAKRLLAGNPDISMNALAKTLGFGTSQNFYHHFKKITGITPTEYLRHLQ